MSVCLIATGGTIASLQDPESRAVRPAVSPEDLIDSVPGLADAGLTRADELAHVNGWNVTPQVMLSVATRAIELLAEDDVDGVVVTHGTDTVEETAFVCDLLVGSEKPVVFAAAMRAGDEVAADGPRNLLAATRVAGATAARRLGSVVVMNDEVHAARWARKLDSFRVNAFASPDHGPVALLAPHELRVLRRPERVTMSIPTDWAPAVPVVQAYTGLHPGLISAVVDVTAASGLVIEGTGLGNLPGSAMAEIEALIARGLPVVVATRTVHGGTSPLYGGPGGGATLRDVGVVGAGSLTAAKARLLMMVLLGQGLSGSEVLERFGATARRLL